jgi:hypothetical protein
MCECRCTFTTLDLGVRGMNHFYPLRENPPVPTVYKSGWAPETVWALWSREKSLAPARNENPTLQHLARHYTY